MANKSKRPTSFHWGSYYAEIEDEKIVAMRPYEKDKDPSTIVNGIVNTLDDPLIEVIAFESIPTVHDSAIDILIFFLINSFTTFLFSRFIKLPT